MADTTVDHDWQDTEYIKDYSEILENCIIFQNVRSLRANFNKVREFSSCLKKQPLVIAMNEIWSPHPWQEMLNGYHRLEKTERNGSSAHKGGGVGMFVRKDIEYETISTVFLDSVIETKTLILKKNKIVVIAIYRPPNKEVNHFLEELKTLIQQIQANYKTYTVLIGGDININLLHTDHEHTQNLLDMAHQQGIIPLINKATRITDTSATAIDVIFSNRSNMKGQILITDISDHLATSVEIPRFRNNKKERVDVGRNFSEKSINALYDELTKTDWSQVYKAEKPCKIFYSLLNKALDKHCPKKQRRCNKAYTPLNAWMTNEILKERMTKLSLHRDAILKKTHEARQRFLAQRNKYNNMLKEAKQKHLYKAIQENSMNSRRIWQLVNEFLNRKSKDKTNIQSLDTPEGKITDAKEIARTFNNFYSTVGPNLAKEIKTTDNWEKFLPKKKYTKMTFHQVTTEEVRKIVTGMAPKKSTGHDDISNFLLKKIIDSTINPLTHIINQSFKEGNFPTEWKCAKVVPIYKGKGSQSHTTNYRPISLLPALSKVIEKIMDKQIRTYMNYHNYWSDTQFGFRRGHETGHAVIKAVNKILKAKNQKKKSLAIFVDCKKAFDTIPHKKLVDKIEQYGIDSKLIKSYLENRTQYTEIKGVKSKKQRLQCGVPQGSILGPLFFIMYINDIREYTNMEVINFADDTTFILSHENREILIENANKNIMAMAEWFDQNGLTINPGKTKVMVFNDKERALYDSKIMWKSTILNRVGEGQEEETVKYVGVHIDENLNFKAHGDYVVKKMSQNMHLISSNKYYIPQATRTMIYNALIRPYMDYGCEVWGKKNMKKITVLQKKCVRHVVNTKNWIAHTNPIFIQLNTPKFQDIVEYHVSRLAYKIVHLRYPKGLKEDFEPKAWRHSTRRLDLHEKRFQYQKDANQIPYQLPRIWNKLRRELKEARTEATFKANHKQSAIIQYTREPACQKQQCPSCSNSRPNFCINHQ